MTALNFDGGRVTTWFGDIGDAITSNFFDHHNPSYEAARLNNASVVFVFCGQQNVLVVAKGDAEAAAYLTGKAATRPDFHAVLAPTEESAWALRRAFERLNGKSRLSIVKG